MRIMCVYNARTSNANLFILQQRSFNIRIMIGPWLIEYFLLSTLFFDSILIPLCLFYTDVSVGVIYWVMRWALMFIECLHIILIIDNINNNFSEIIY